MGRPCETCFFFGSLSISLVFVHVNIVWFQKISIPISRMVIGNYEGEGVTKAKIFKGKYGTKRVIPGGWEDPNPKPTLGGVMDIFLNHTF